MLDDRPHSRRGPVRGPAPWVLGRLMVRHQPQRLHRRRSVSRVLVPELLTDHPIPRPLRSRFFLGHRCERRLECPSVRAQLRARGDGGPRRGSGFAASLQTPLASSLFSWLRAVRRPSRGRPVLRLCSVAVRGRGGARVAVRRDNGRGPLAVVAAWRRRRARRPRGVAVVGHVCGRFSSAVC